MYWLNRLDPLLCIVLILKMIRIYGYGFDCLKFKDFIIFQWNSLFSAYVAM
jgi:hypothetical protein